MSLDLYSKAREVFIFGDQSVFQRRGVFFQTEFKKTFTRDICHPSKVR